VEKNFFARTTPFPISPQAIDKYINCRELILGTKVVLDTVYRNFGNDDRLGFNTVVDSVHYQNYYHNPHLPVNLATQDRIPGNIYISPGMFYYIEGDLVFGMKLTLVENDSIILKRNKDLWMIGKDYHYSGDTIIFRGNSNIVLDYKAGINASNGGVIIDSGCNSSYSDLSHHRIFDHSSIIYTNNSHKINNGGYLEINEYSNLILGDNALLTFDGAGTYLKLNSNSIVQLGQNAKILFTNGAYLIADGSNISSIVSSHGRGLVFEDAGAQTSITNCTFGNLTNSIYIDNSNAIYGDVFRNISNNTFTTDNACNYVIETAHANNITIANNTITMSAGKGIGILMRYPVNLLSAAGSGTTYYGISVINNKIYNGMISASILSQTSSMTPVNFSGSNILTNAASYNFVGRQITGNIKNNNFESNQSGCKNMELTQSVPNVLGNTFTTPYINFYNYDSYPKLAPSTEPTTDAGWIWVGGKNKFTSTGNGNIYLYGGNAGLDWGQNCFFKAVSPDFPFMSGSVSLPTTTYYLRNNDFNGTNYPSPTLFHLYVYNGTGDILPNFDGSNFSCPNSTDAGIIWQINDLGNGIKDTIYKSANTSGILRTPDEYLYSQSLQENSSNNYFEAISYLKALLNEYTNSIYVNSALIDLYTNYQALDTSGNQGIRNTLYNDLKNYLDAKILSGLFNDDFNYKAYNITLMCLDNMTEYNDALSGYELIALYHPDAYIRLLASWDYDEIQTLLNGSGGFSSEEEYMTDKEFQDKLIKKVNKSINNDPIKKMVKKSYDNIKEKKSKRMEEDVLSRTGDIKTAKQEMGRIKQIEDKLSEKSIAVLRYSKTLTKEEKDKQRVEDLLLSERDINKNKNTTITSNVPLTYNLSQNYPNPFNPTTKINYALPKTGLVTMKIYDVTGREIQTLVNDVKQAGNYTVDFNGSSLSSGVYFYMIKSSDFVMTKRMVLIK
jgi:tetratricopeptide (TPR) repeat protein